MRVRVLGAHNLETGRARHTCFLIDGVLGIDAGSLVSSLSLVEQGEIRALLITHQHFDHARDIPTLGLTTMGSAEPIHLYGLPATLESVHAHLLDGQVYPDLTKELNDTPPRFRSHSIEPDVAFETLGYTVKAVEASHPVPAVGYIIKSPSGRCVAFTGDTDGDILPILQDEFAPEVVFIDVTYPNRLQWRAEVSGHLTPSLLERQLGPALSASVRLPKIVPVHLSLHERDEIREELSAVAERLGVELTPGYEDMML
ncbi:MAG: MBL fold metallo-hydrolase [Chloroflexi bacterium]|nr:MBL fold metallo-hydrolase [Chloroflexota bacterium]